jgi:hypothetical protein
MTELYKVGNCANPECTEQFRRLGEGTMSVFVIAEPELWGLPPDTRQKVVWLCSRCSSSLYVRADYRHHGIRLLHKPRQQISAA